MNRRVLLLLITLGLLFVWTEAPFHRHPDQVANDRFVSVDESVPLWLVDGLNQGKGLYRDLFSQYGPLPIWIYACYAQFFGNSAESYMHLQQIYSLLAALLIWIFLSRHMRPASVAFFLLVFMAPYLLLVGASAGSLTGEPYGLERLFLIVLVLLWKPWRATSIQYMLLVGAVMGAMQLVKFGGGIVAIGAWVLADLCLWHADWRALARRWAYLIAGYSAVTVVWGATLLLWLPWEMAWDVFCPLYVMDAYACLYTAGHNYRWPHYYNFGFFLGGQVGPLIALVLLIGTIFMVFYRSGRTKEYPDTATVGPFLFAGFFFLIGAEIYLKHVWLLFAFAWLLILSSAWVWIRLPVILRLGITLCWLPVFYLNVREPWLPMSQEIHSVIMPNGQVIWLNEKMTARYERVNSVVNELISRHPQQDSVLAYPLGAGWCHFFKWPVAIRNIWFLNGFIRPYDEPVLADSLRRTAAVIVVTPDLNGHAPTSDPRTWTEGPSCFPDVLCDLFARRLGKAIKIDEGCWVFPVLPNEQSTEATRK